MDFTTNDTNRTDEIIRLFQDTFTASEGAAEGDLIAQLVAKMFATVAKDDIFVFSALDDDKLVGTIIFTRISYPQEDRSAFILSPAAVASNQHGKGIGQALINHGLNTLRENGVDVALTYGDFNFYSKVGFAQITEDIARPPLPLTYPEGWLGLSMTDGTLVPLSGPSTCVEALNDPAMW